MNRISLRAPLVAIACLVAAWTPPAGAAEQFSAAFTGYADPMISTPCLWTNTETGSGNSTLGGFDWQSSETADFCSSPGEILVDGEFVLTFATGALGGSYQSTGEPLLLQGQLYFEGTFELDPQGGTGTFSGYTGSGFINALATGPPEWGFGATLQGQIDRGTSGD